jgi:hypothetical protein
MPGSSTDWVFLSGGTFNQTQEFTAPGARTGEDISSFDPFGGVGGENGGSSNYSSITPPGGASALQTGDVDASTSNALYNGYNDGGSEITIGLQPTGNSNFNYNDFNVYVMISNTTAHKDGDVLLANNSPDFSSTSGTSVAETVTDSNSSLASAQYIEFNVQGFGTYLTAGNYLVLGAQSTSGDAYLGGVSFESLPAPEPSVFAMMLGGLGLLAFGRRIAKFRAGSVL